MATSITISVGPLTRSRTFQNDTKASAALLAFHDAYGLSPADGTNAAKLGAIIDWVVGQVVRVSTQAHVESLLDANQAAARALYEFNKE